MHAWKAGTSFVSTPIIAVVILIIPIFDTIRVFSIRIFRGISPLKADRRHMHHLLIDNNLSHIQASFSLYFVTIFLTAITHFARTYFSNTELCFFVLLLLVSYFIVGNLLEIRRLKLKKEELVSEKTTNIIPPTGKELKLTETNK
jgi:hypothetical protein